MNEIEEAKIAQQKAEHGGAYARPRRNAATQAKKIIEESSRSVAIQKLMRNADNQDEAYKKEESKKQKTQSESSIYVFLNN